MLLSISNDHEANHNHPIRCQELVRSVPMPGKVRPDVVFSCGMKLGSLRSCVVSVVAPEAVLLAQAYFISSPFLLVK